MKKAWLIVVVLLSVSLTACASPAAAPGTAPDKVLIGGPMSISGQLAKEGEQSVWGVQAGVKWVNEANGGVKVGGKKVPIEYKYYDDESKKELVTSLIERAITVDKVNAVMSPYSSGLVLAGAPIAEKYGVLYMNHGGASDRIHEQGYKYVVMAYVPGRRYHLGALDMFKKIGPNAKRLALSYEEDEFAMMAREGAMQYAAKLGYEIVFNRNYPSKVADLTPILSDLKASKPDIILGGGHFADTRLFAKQMSDLGIDVKGISLAVGPTLPAYYEALGPLARSSPSLDTLPTARPASHSTVCLRCDASQELAPGAPD